MFDKIKIKSKNGYPIGKKRAVNFNKLKISLKKRVFFLIKFADTLISFLHLYKTKTKNYNIIKLFFVSVYTNNGNKANLECSLYKVKGNTFLFQN